MRIKTIVFMLIFVMATVFHSYVSANESFPKHEPYGKGIGAMPGRVVWSYDPDSVDWDGNGYWWQPDNFNETVMLDMVNSSIAKLGGKNTASEGWRALFENYNSRHGKSGGYVKGDKIAIKANINGSAVMDDDTSGETKMSYTNPVLLKTLLTSLVAECGVNPSDITVYDVSRLFPDYMVEMCNEGILQGISFVNRDNGIADENVPINWSYEFSGRVNYIPTCVTDAEYVINFANLKGHSYGITLCGKNHFGSFINGSAMRPPEGANLHQWLTKGEMGIYSPLVDLMAHYVLGDKTVLYMLDAIICAPSEGASITGSNSKWQQSPFNGDYTSSIFVSQDPVEIDSVGADFLLNEPTVLDNNYSARDITSENYLHEAALVSNPPSGTKYTDSNGNAVENLGVHEHWNNAEEKKYSRNLGKSEGIELVMAENMGSPEMTFENNIVTVKGAPSGSTLITTVYNKGVLESVKLYKGENEITADLTDSFTKGDVIKAFLWDLNTIKPLLPALTQSAAASPTEAVGKTLIAYFSCTGTTEKIAEQIETAASADIYKIEAAVPYTAKDLEYYTDCRADKEQSDPNARPEISNLPGSLDSYDTIFLGYPIWHGQAPKIIYTFLEAYDFSGKTIIPFCTSHSSLIGSSDTNLHPLADKAAWISGRRFAGNTSAAEIAGWVNEIMN